MYLSPGSERHMGRSLQRYTLNGLRTLQGRNPKRAPRVSFRAPPTNRARSRTIKKHLPPETKELPPRAPAPNKANQIFALRGRVRLGEVLGGCGRFGGRGAPLSRGAPLPPRSSSPRKFFLQSPRRSTEKAGRDVYNRGDRRSQRRDSRERGGRTWTFTWTCIF